MDILISMIEEQYESVSGWHFMFRTSVQDHSEAGHSDRKNVLRIISLDEDMIHWTPGGLQERVPIVKEITGFKLLRN
jgi:hypothetical protein